MCVCTYKLTYVYNIYACIYMYVYLRTYVITYLYLGEIGSFLIVTAVSFFIATAAALEVRPSGLTEVWSDLHQSRKYGYSYTAKDQVNESLLTSRFPILQLV